MLSTTRAAAASPPPTEDKSSSPHYQASIVSHSLSSSSIRPHEDRSTLDLINSYAVFKLCTIPVVVETTPTIIEFMEKIGLSWPMYAIIKRTFFRHFCGKKVGGSVNVGVVGEARIFLRNNFTNQQSYSKGGENLEEVLPTMNKLSKNSVGSILDLAMEADIEDTVSQTPIESQASAAKIRGMMEESINIAAHQPDSFIAVKVTAMVPPTILLRWTNTLHVLKKHFAASGDNGSDRISVQDLNKIMATQLNLSEAESKSIRSVFEKVNKDG